MPRFLHINVVDVRSGHRALFEADMERWRHPTYNIEIDNAWSMDRICRRILQHLREHDDGAIGILRLFGHGSPGHVELGMGLDVNSARNFSLLRGHFGGRYPRIELHSCGVVSGTPVSDAGPRGTISPNSPGHALMQALATASGVLTIASYDVQRADQEMAMEGRVRHYRP